jgi:hypothetical protein
VAWRTPRRDARGHHAVATHARGAVARPSRACRSGPNTVFPYSTPMVRGRHWTTREAAAFFSSATLEGPCNSREERGTSRATESRKMAVVEGAHQLGAVAASAAPNPVRLMTCRWMGRRGEGGGGDWRTSWRMKSCGAERWQRDRAALFKAAEGSSRGRLSAHWRGGGGGPR